MFLWRIGHEPLWLDETYTFAMVQHGLAEIVGLTAKDHPPLYYLLLRLWTDLFGDSRVALLVATLVVKTWLRILADCSTNVQGVSFTPVAGGRGGGG